MRPPHRCTARTAAATVVYPSVHFRCCRHTSDTNRIRIGSKRHVARLGFHRPIRLYARTPTLPVKIGAAYMPAKARARAATKRLLYNARHALVTPRHPRRPLLNALAALPNSGVPCAVLPYLTIKPTKSGALSMVLPSVSRPIRHKHRTAAPRPGPDSTLGNHQQASQTSKSASECNFHKTARPEATPNTGLPADIPPCVSVVAHFSILTCSNAGVPSVNLCARLMRSRLQHSQQSQTDRRPTPGTARYLARVPPMQRYMIVGCFYLRRGCLVSTTAASSSDAATVSSSATKYPLGLWIAFLGLTLILVQPPSIR